MDKVKVEMGRKILDLDALDELNAETRVKDMFRIVRATEMGSLKIVARNDAGEPTCALIVVDGVRETKAILDVVEPVEDSWGK